ncbi:hypothetical protein BDZ94DRAFT_500386 [Collybia nuda]|uniref:Fungal calcium binding protein domain-containing protein n=1 Tax=Collybia nuda TaxID=64659 RepID=A0A9P5XUW2_9AGAR|nr:hypothetical protein BDZ94DRAFT_500386 [Collybia nuda]
MQFTSIFAVIFVAASAVLAVPTGNTFMRASCDIAGCVAALAPGVVSCGAAAAQGGANVISDAGCLASAANTIANFPADCDQCAEEFGITQKAEAAGSAIKNAAGDAVDEVKDVAGKAGDALGKIF